MIPTNQSTVCHGISTNESAPLCDRFVQKPRRPDQAERGPASSRAGHENISNMKIFQTSKYSGHKYFLLGPSRWSTGGPRGPDTSPAQQSPTLRQNEPRTLVPIVFLISGVLDCCCLIVGARKRTLTVGEDPEDNVEHPECEGDDGGVSVEYREENTDWDEAWDGKEYSFYFQTERGQLMDVMDGR